MRIPIYIRVKEINPEFLKAIESRSFSTDEALMYKEEFAEKKKKQTKNSPAMEYSYYFSDLWLF